MRHRLISFFDIEQEEPALSDSNRHPPPPKRPEPREPEYFVQLLNYLRQRNEAIRKEQDQLQEVSR